MGDWLVEVLKDPAVQVALRLKFDVADASARVIDVSTALSVLNSALPEKLEVVKLSGHMAGRPVAFLVVTDK